MGGKTGGGRGTVCFGSGADRAGVAGSGPLPSRPAVSAIETGPWNLRQRAGRLLLDFAGIELELEPGRGGRIAALRAEGVDLLVGPDVHPSNWGSTYWTSPQEDWGWPPVAVLDDEPYQVTIEGSTVVMTSAEARAGSKPLTVTKRLTPRPEQRALAVEYVVRNSGAEPYSIASWEISRVPPGGLSFFEAGAVEYTRVGPHSVLPTTKRRGITWFDHRDFVPGQGAKLNADSPGNWLAHVVRSPGAGKPHVLFLKGFEPVPLAQQAPGEGVIELYADELGSYVEVENQGPFAPVPPGGTSAYRVIWRLEALPSGLEPLADSEALLSWVRSVLVVP